MTKQIQLRVNSWTHSLNYHHNRQERRLAVMRRDVNDICNLFYTKQMLHKLFSVDGIVNHVIKFLIDIPCIDDIKMLYNIFKQETTKRIAMK